MGNALAPNARDRCITSQIPEMCAAGKGNRNKRTCFILKNITSSNGAVIERSELPEGAMTVISKW